MKNKNVWIPESSTHHGLYANSTGDDLAHGKIRGKKLQPSTYNIYESLQFVTKEACQQWCDTNPKPVFVPTEHEFFKPENLYSIVNPSLNPLLEEVKKYTRDDMEECYVGGWDAAKTHNEGETHLIFSEWIIQFTEGK